MKYIRGETKDPNGDQQDNSRRQEQQRKPHLLQPSPKPAAAKDQTPDGKPTRAHDAWDSRLESWRAIT